MSTLQWTCMCVGRFLTGAVAMLIFNLWLVGHLMGPMVNSIRNFGRRK
jgi:hypothetical protein